MHTGTHSFRLIGAACLTFCGLAAIAAGVGTAALPWHVRVCATSTPAPCCTKSVVPPVAESRVPAATPD
jgi:hypothetical protein